MKSLTRQTRPGGRRAREKGIALVIAVFTIAALLVAITGALVTSSANSKAAWNYKAASQAHFVAESGISHALQTINAIGAVNYNNEIVQNWSTMFGTAAKTFNPSNPNDGSGPGVSGYTYTVTNTAGAIPASSGRLVATATQRDSSNNIIATNTVVANIVRDNNPSTAPGAIYLATDSNSNATFTGNSFAVESCHIKIADSDVAAHIWRFLYDTARQYRESFDVYGSKKSFEWTLVEGEKHVLHTAKRPEPEIASTVEVPDFAHLLPKEIQPFTRSIMDADHLSFLQGGGHGGSHPHLVNEFIRALVDDRDPWPNAPTSANWTCVGILAHESAQAGGEIRKLPGFTLAK